MVALEGTRTREEMFWCVVLWEGGPGQYLISWNTGGTRGDQGGHERNGEHVRTVIARLGQAESDLRVHGEFAFEFSV